MTFELKIFKKYRMMQVLNHNPLLDKSHFQKRIQVFSKKETNNE